MGGPRVCHQVNLVFGIDILCYEDGIEMLRRASVGSPARKLGQKRRKLQYSSLTLTSESSFNVTRRF